MLQLSIDFVFLWRQGIILLLKVSFNAHVVFVEGWAIFFSLRLCDARILQIKLVSRLSRKLVSTSEYVHSMYFLGRVGRKISTDLNSSLILIPSNLDIFLYTQASSSLFMSNSFRFRFRHSPFYNKEMTPSKTNRTLNFARHFVWRPASPLSTELWFKTWRPFFYQTRKNPAFLLLLASTAEHISRTKTRFSHANFDSWWWKGRREEKISRKEQVLPLLLTPGSILFLLCTIYDVRPTRDPSSCLISS